MAGLHIRHRNGNPAGFWYSHPVGIPKDQFIRDTVRSHVVNCGRELVRVGEDDVIREIPAAEWLAVYGEKLVVGVDGVPSVENGSPVDVAALV